MPYKDFETRRHTKEYKEARRKSTIKRKYGITTEDFDILFDMQHGRCAICDEPFAKRPHIDHDHKTGRVRGLLCANCNYGLGFFKDSLKIIDRIKFYLR